MNISRYRKVEHAFFLLFLASFLFSAQGCQSPPAPEIPLAKQETNQRQTDSAAIPAAVAANEQPSLSIVYSKKYLINLAGLEKSHPFDIRKYEKIHKQLVADELISESFAKAPDPISKEEILLVHSQQYVKSLKNRRKLARYLESELLLAYPFSLDSGILKPFRHSSGGTILAARLALQNGIGVNIGGGYHHAKPNTGEGFCIYADVPIAIRKLQAEKLIKRAVIIDVDAHQGNGTAVCLADDESTYTFSIHQGNIYPIPKENGDWDIEIDAGTDDEQYMKILNEHLQKVLDNAEADICFIMGGCDTLRNDPLTSLGMTHEGIVKRDQAIVDACVKRKLPVVLTLSGGYSKNAWEAQYKSIRNLVERYPLADE